MNVNFELTNVARMQYARMKLEITLVYVILDLKWRKTMLAQVDRRLKKISLFYSNFFECFTRHR